MRLCRAVAERHDIRSEASMCRVNSVVEMSLTMPPMGLLIFVMKGVAPPGTRIQEIWLAALPFMLCGIDRDARDRHSPKSDIINFSGVVGGFV